MPIRLPSSFPAKIHLEDEGIKSLSFKRASEQDIRPLKIALLNLMPTKIATEVQILRLLSCSSIQIEPQFIRLGSHNVKYGEDHLDEFYTDFKNISQQKFDGLIITGAPVEQLEFEDVDYFSELKQVIEYAKTNVFASLHICWGAQAGLYLNYHIKKELYAKKVFGVFEHYVKNKNALTLGFDDIVNIPHSRHSGVNQDQLNSLFDSQELVNIVNSDVLGSAIMATKDLKNVYVLGHMEYDRETLDLEYKRDLMTDKKIEIPSNYYLDDDHNKEIIMSWHSHANLLFSNWVDFIYQETPYNLENL